MLSEQLIKKLLEKTLSVEEQREEGRRMLEDRQEWNDVLEIIGTLKNFRVKEDLTYLEARLSLLARIDSLAEK